MSSNQKEKEQKVGLWVAGSAAGLSVLVILFLSVWGWETGRIEGSPDYGRAASEVQAEEDKIEEIDLHFVEDENGGAIIMFGKGDAAEQEETAEIVIETAEAVEPAPVPEPPAPAVEPVEPVAPAGHQDAAAAENTGEDAAKIVTHGGTVKFYFASGKSDVAAGAQEALKDVLVAALAGKKVVVSGYHDNTGNSEFNEELSKRRALAVRAVLQGFGVPEKQIELRKPADADAGVGAEARRVEVFAE